MACPKDTILKKYKEMDTLLTNKDFNALMAYWAPDGKLMPEGHDLVSGPEQIAAYSTKEYASNYEHVTSNVDEVVGDGEYVVSRGHYSAKPKSGGDAECGKFVTVWKKINNDYFIYLDVWNQNKKH